ncbi:MAG: hypothetical protein IJK93_05160 [Muribaculaceae bacterium]|nr:hypothetical protein [Muribaculaceae bacterium]
MKVLVLHNNNLPEYLLFPSSLNEKGIDLSPHPFALPPTDVPDFDTFTCSELEFLKDNHYDLIILPYNLSETYTEFSGLRVAAHIRLTPEWNCLRTPILFLGPDNINEIMLFSPLCALLNSTNVFRSSVKEEERISNMIKKIYDLVPAKSQTNEEVMNSFEYQSLLQYLKTIPVPANYATHHSIANEWAIIRWKEMFLWKEGEEPSLPNEDFANMLYFKYLMCSAGQREHYGRKKKNQIPKSHILKNRRIVYIDDEANKGWAAILATILSGSGAELITYPFLDLQKSINKNDLIQDIIRFLDKDYEDNGCADCYIIDLRLHDEDFQETLKYSELSGHKIARYIVKKDKDKDNKRVGLNPYNQIVVFSASNKVWNLKEELLEIGASGYAMKESPEQNLSRDESYRGFNEFFNAIKAACNMSYLKEWYNELEQLQKKLGYSEDDLSLLYEFLSLIKIDNGKNRSELLRACVLTLYAFFETYIEREEFKLIGTELFKGSLSVGHWKRRVLFQTQKENSKRKKYIGVQCYKQPLLTVNPGWEDPDEKAKPSQIIIPLYLFYNILSDDLSDILQLVNERNKGAHEGICSFSIEQFKKVFNNVILPMLKKR